MTLHRALTISQAAELLQASTDTVRRMIDDGRVPASRLDPSTEQSPWRIPRASLDPWCGPASASETTPATDESDAAMLEARARALASGGGLSREAMARFARVAEGLDPEPPIPMTGHHRRRERDPEPPISMTGHHREADGLDSEPPIPMTGHHGDDTFGAATDTPSGTVAPEHPAPVREPVVMLGRYTPPIEPHPSERLVPAEELARRRAVRMQGISGNVTPTGHRTQLFSDSREAPPFDGDSFGAGEPTEPPAS